MNSFTCLRRGNPRSADGDHVAKEAGFTLREIKQLINGFASETPAGARWQKLATAKLAEMEALAARVV
jgi:DNA-binding transcriptional MerR regulator